MIVDDEQKERLESYKKQFEPLTQWLGNKLGAWITRCVVSRRLHRSPAALAATAFGWTGNMERLALSNAHQKVRVGAAHPPPATRHPPLPTASLCRRPTTRSASTT